MAEEEKTVDIDTSGPGAEVELPVEESKNENEQQQTQQQQQSNKKKDPIKGMKTNVKQNLKTVVAPMIHLRNLMSSLLLKNSLKKLKNKKIKDFLKMK